MDNNWTEIWPANIISHAVFIVHFSLTPPVPHFFVIFSRDKMYTGKKPRNRPWEVTDMIMGYEDQPVMSLDSYPRDQYIHTVLGRSLMLG